jgi:mRNA-degrading endonuclease toxin of MazEF toxin-antitoxin module
LNSVACGDVFHVDLNPIQSREQAGARYVVIVWSKAFNVLGTPLVCPITQGGNFARHAGFAVPLSGAGTETQGVVLCNQPRVLASTGPQSAVHREGAGFHHG